MGLLQYNRLVFGITSAPAIWQCTIDQVLEGTSGTSCILDDMIITGKNDEEHLANLEEALRCLQVHGLRQSASFSRRQPSMDMISTVMVSTSHHRKWKQF